MSKGQVIVFSMAFLTMSILFSPYSSILQVSCWLTGVGFLIKALTTK